MYKRNITIIEEYLRKDATHVRKRQLNTPENYYDLIPINLLKPTAYGMHQQVEYFNNYTLCPHCSYVYCICIRTNSDLCHLHHKLIGFYKRDEKCLQRGTDWGFK
jgi:hypothetical protein